MRLQKDPFENCFSPVDPVLAKVSSTRGLTTSRQAFFGKQNFLVILEI